MLILCHCSLENKFEELLEAWMKSADKPADPDLRSS